VRFDLNWYLLNELFYLANCAFLVQGSLVPCTNNDSSLTAELRAQIRVERS